MLEPGSADNGTSWSTAVVLGSSAVTTARINDSPSIITTSSTKSYVEWNGWQASYANCGLSLRCAGSPCRM